MIPLNRVLLGGVVLLTLNSVQAQTSANIYLQGGAQPGALACVACHGADGMGLAPAGFPRLAGISADYLSKQLRDFQSGKRVSPVMQPLAKALTDDEIALVTQAIAAMPAPPVPLINRSSMPEGVGGNAGIAWRLGSANPGVRELSWAGRGRGGQRFPATGQSACAVSGGAVECLARWLAQE